MIFLSIILSWLMNPSQDCKLEVREAYSEMRKLSEPTSGFYIEYSVNAEDWDEVCRKEVTSIRKNGDKVKVYTSGVELYQDDETMVAINHVSKSVFLTKPVKKSVKQDQLSVFTSMLDSLFIHLQVLECETICQDNKKNLTYRKISFGLPEAMNGSYGIQKITYWLLENDSRIKRILLEYTDEAQMKSLDFDLLELNSSYNEIPFPKKAINQVLDKDGKLLSAYKQFEILDKRKG